MSARGHQPPLRTRSRRPLAGRELTSAAALGTDTAKSIAQRNIELHDRLVRATNAREVPAEMLAPGFRLENRVTAVTDNTYRGAEGWREWMSDLFDVFADGAHYELEEVIAAGRDYVAALMCVSGHGARSGLPISFRWAGVTWLRGEKVMRVIGYATREDALRAVGLQD